MNQEIDETKYKKSLKILIDEDHPHLLLFAPKRSLLSGKITAYCLETAIHDLEKLQYALAKLSSEDELQELIDFFTEALKRRRKIRYGTKGEVIPFNDKT